VSIAAVVVFRIWNFRRIDEGSQAVAVDTSFSARQLFVIFEG
jgi:hypothetical protein